MNALFSLRPTTRNAVVGLLPQPPLDRERAIFVPICTAVVMSFSIVAIQLVCVAFICVTRACTCGSSSWSILPIAVQQLLHAVLHQIPIEAYGLAIPSE